MKNTNNRKAVKTKRDKKKVYNQFSDFSREIPNLVNVGDKYQARGNVCLGTATNAYTWKPWRFGKKSYLLHPITVIQIGKVKTLYLNTALVCEYLIRNKSRLRELESAGFKGLKTRSYIVNIQDLENFCNEESLLIAS